MLTSHDIKTIISTGEGYNAEFKIRLPSKIKDVVSEVCAFANAAGGVVILGVSDNNTIIGDDISNSKRSALQNALNEINPHIYCPIYPVEVDNKTVWVIEVQAGPQKPYIFSGAIYVRQGACTQKILTVEQMREYFQQSNRIYFDELVNHEFNTNHHIDRIAFEEFRAQSGLSLAVDMMQVFNNLRLIASDGSSIKNGGVLFFGRNPDDFIETAVLRCLAFNGITKTDIIDDKVFKGHLMHQYKQAMQWLRQKLDVRYKIQGSGPREEIWEIPEDVFKEAIINALSHRDYYDKGAKILIEVFDDRVEISNPGALVSAISPQDFGSRSHSRNPLIFGLFARMKMVEQVGSGIGRMRSLMISGELPLPVFKTEGMFTVVLHRKSVFNEWVNKWVDFLTENRIKILKLIFENPYISKSRLEEKTGLSKTAIDNNMKFLKDNGFLIREGNNRKGHWNVLFRQHPGG